MNLIDYQVTEVLTNPTRVECEGIVWWEVLCMTVDDYPFPRLETLSFATEDQALQVRVGYIGQH